ncbi:MAG: hypothetical protein QXO02_08955 [Thermofilaceae archaeon]
MKLLIATVLMKFRARSVRPELLGCVVIVRRTSDAYRVIMLSTISRLRHKQPASQVSLHVTSLSTISPLLHSISLEPELRDSWARWARVGLYDERNGTNVLRKPRAMLNLRDTPVRGRPIFTVI